jgi:hypothetical protein
VCRTAVPHLDPEKDTVLEVISPTSIMCKSDKNSGSSKSETDRRSAQTRTSHGRDGGYSRIHCS